MTAWVSKYTVGAAVALLLLGALWLAFGGRLSAWSAGVYAAIKGNAASIEQLKRAQQDAAAARAEGQQLKQAVGALGRQARELQRQFDAKVAAAAAQGQLAAQLRARVVELETQRQAAPTVTTPSEAYRALQALGPPYSRR